MCRDCRKVEDLQFALEESNIERSELEVCFVHQKFYLCSFKKFSLNKYQIWLKPVCFGKTIFCIYLQAVIFPYYFSFSQFFQAEFEKKRNQFRELEGKFQKEADLTNRLSNELAAIKVSAW